MSIHIIDMEVRGIKNFLDGHFYVSFRNEKRANADELENNIVTKVAGTNYRNNVVAFAGINASGKTTALRILDFVLSVFIEGDGLNDDYDILELFQDKITFKLYFSNESNYIYEVKSEIHKINEKLTFYEEKIIQKKVTNYESKNTLLDFTKYEQQFIRTELESTKSQFLKDDDSIFPAVGNFKKDIPISYSTNTFDTTDINILSVGSNLDSILIKYLDNSIEEFTSLNKEETESKSIPMFKIKFFDEDPVESSLFDLGKYLSSGTIKGLSVLNYVARTMKYGGYLLIDEIENHFNKVIVENIINFFQSDLNINGATLIFSTHYSELLDRVERSESIKILKKTSGKCSINSLSSLASQHNKDRTDIKKSDLILSGIFGTAPSYNNYKNVRELLQKVIGNDIYEK